MVFPRNKPPSISQMVLENNGVCECGFFSSKNLLLSDDPLWIEFVMHTPCPTDKSCMTLCQILGMKVKVLEPERLCKRIQQNVHDVQVRILIVAIRKILKQCIVLDFNLLQSMQ